jgi:hypothetical protein
MNSACVEVVHKNPVSAVTILFFPLVLGTTGSRCLFRCLVLECASFCMPPVVGLVEYVEGRSSQECLIDPDPHVVMYVNILHSNCDVWCVLAHPRVSVCSVVRD